MRRRYRQQPGRITGAALCAAFVSSLTGAVLADVMAAGPYEQVVSKTIPVGGVIGVLKTCPNCAEDMAPMAFDVVDAMGDAVVGAVVDGGRTPSGFWTVWKADEDLPVGEYEIELLLLDGSGQVHPGNVVIAVEDASVPAEGAVNFSVSSALGTAVHGEPSCCLDGPRNSNTNQTSCVWPEREVSLQLAVALPKPEEFLGQVLFDVSWSAEDPADATTQKVFGGDAKHYFQTQALQYCATVTAVRLTDGRTSELGTRCAAHGELADLGVVPSTEQQLEADLRNCTDPPPEYLEQWCEIEDLTVCANQDCPLLGQCGTPIDDGPVLKATSSEGGCALVPSERGSFYPYWFLLMVGLVRRRRSSARDSSSCAERALFGERSSLH